MTPRVSSITIFGSRSISMSRRNLLSGTAALAAALAFPIDLRAQQPSPPKQPMFYSVSQSITGKSDLSATTSDRIFEALLEDHGDLSATTRALAGIAETHPDAKSFRAVAEQEGHADILLAILTAWYTGTVDTMKGPVVVAYKDALMYRPVEDGLTVPTYCNKGPMWWTGLPPELTRMPTNNPKVL